MNEKPWYLSKGILGPLAAMIAEMIRTFGEKVGIDVDTNQIMDALLQIVVLAGIIVGIIGRWRAPGPIKSITK